MAGRTYWAEQLDEDPVVLPDHGDDDGAPVTISGIDWSHLRDLVAPIDVRSLEHPVGVGR